MKAHLLLLWIVLTLATSCTTYHHVQSVDVTAVRMTADAAAPDSAITAMIAPYKRDLDASMNAVIGLASHTLPKGRPESLLGNWATDAIHAQGERYTGERIDLAFTNSGGLRIPALPAGEITVGKIYELMPFDNILVTLQLSGAEVQALADYAAARGGEPVSRHLRFTIAEDRAQGVTLDGEPLDTAATYTVLTTDYLANGGDHLHFFKGKPQRSLEVYFRDALIDHIKALTAVGESVHAQLDGRIRAAE